MAQKALNAAAATIRYSVPGLLITQLLDVGLRSSPIKESFRVAASPTESFGAVNDRVLPSFRPPASTSQAEIPVGKNCNDLFHPGFGRSRMLKSQRRYLCCCLIRKKKINSLPALAPERIVVAHAS
jgi:hypothetical protein